MPSDPLELDSLTEARRKGLEETIRPISVDQLNALGEELFPSTDHPWRERYLQFIKENSGETFYHAVTNDRVHILYCRGKNVGAWFTGNGVGPLQAKGREILKEIVEAL
jgi:hypothetical protein